VREGFFSRLEEGVKPIVECRLVLVDTTPWDAAELLDTEEYLAVTFEDGEPSEIAHALGVIARARGMTDLASKTGLTRQSLYKALSGDGNPELATITKVGDALGFRLTFVRT
jgi:probable addiction module antidote protein